MKKFLLSLVVALMAVTASAVNLSNETLHYKVTYKWGIVHKDAGKATITLRVNGNNCKATLVGRTDPWADKIYHLRDTLKSSFSKSTCIPTRYERIAHEDGRYAHDIVNISRNGQTFTGKCTRYRRAKNTSKVTTASTALSAQGMTVDMLSAFYYIRTLDFENMAKGHTSKSNIFSGKKKEMLTITYKGREKVKINGKNQDAYRIRFTFTTDGRKQSSEPIEAWISTDARHIPLLIEGSLKIGKVRCIYTGG